MTKKDGQRTRAVAYIRVSTDKQRDSGSSLDAQGAAIRAYCALYNVDLVPLPPEGQGPPAPFAMDDGYSASTLDRPALQKALAMLQSGQASALIVAKLDRLTRSIGDLSTLIADHFDDRSLLSVSEQIDTRTAGGRMVLNLITVISQWEREAIGERTAAVMQHMAREGYYCGGRVPFGRSKDGDRLADNPHEQAILEQARKCRASGLSLRETALFLEGKGMRPRAGGRWAPTQVARMVS